MKTIPFSFFLKSILVICLLTNFSSLLNGQTHYWLSHQWQVNDFNQNIKSISGNLVIGTSNGTTNISDISKLSKLESIGGNLVIMNNDNLKDLEGLQNITSVGDTLRIIGQDFMTDLEGLNGLTTVGGLHIEESNGLTSLNGLNNLTEVNGTFELRLNESLTSLEGCNNIEQISIDLNIFKNDRLKNLDGLSNLHNVGNDLLIRLNHDLNNIDGLIKLTQLGGDVSVSSHNLQNVNGLSGLAEIKGSLFIDSWSVKNIDGLNNINSIGEDLLIFFCDSLTSIDGLQNIESIGGYIELNNLRLVKNIDALSKIDSIKSSIKLKNLVQLENIDGLQDVVSIGGNLTIIGCEKITSIDALDDITTINGSLYMTNNFKLKNLDGLSNVTSIDGRLYLSQNVSLENIDGLSNIESIDGELRIFRLDSITNLDALSKIKHVNGSLNITANYSLQNIDGLRNIESIGEGLTIGSNTLITDIDALSKIDSVYGWLSIRYNMNLLNLDGLKRIAYVEGTLRIKDNASLTDCCAIHRLLADQNSIIGDVDILNNPSSCSSEQEVLETVCIDEYNGVFGNVYFDANQNQQQDQGEFGIPHVEVITLEESGIALTNSLGNYALKVTDGLAYTLGLALDQSWEVTTENEFYSFQFEAGNTGNFDFGLYNSDVTPSSQLSITSEATRCNTSVDFYIRLSNDGFLASSGELKIKLDEQTGFVSSIPALIETDEFLVYSFDNLKPFESIDFNVTLDMPSEQSTGDEIIIKGEVYYLDENDNLQLIDKADYNSIILCSYDPNDKQVNPIGVKAENYTLLSDDLNYTIRFQNTGNASAIDVRIIDTLDENLDLETFSVLNSSHELRTNLNGRVVEFLFKDIYLPDSLSNEPESHGFVHYSINPIVGLEELTKIKNTAHIIFDFNPPIITNTTENTMVEMICEDVFTNVDITICEGEEFMGYTEDGNYNFSIPIGITCDSLISLDLVVLPDSDPACIVSTNNYENLDLQIYPNPVGNLLYVKSNISNLIHQLIDINGKSILVSKQAEIEVGDLLPGIYFLKSYGEKVSSIRKVIKL